MAILSKIRERSMFLILVIGLALFAFVLDPSQLTDFFNASKVNEIGEVNGESISRQEFAEALDAYKTQTGNRATEMQAARFVWDNLVRKKIYTKQLEEAGITIGEEDIMKALAEAPSVQNNPDFKTAGLFDIEKLKGFLKTQKDENSDLWKAWQRYMAQIEENLQTRTYNNLVGAGLGASLKEGETQYFNDNTKYSAEYVYVPYTTIADSLITIKKSEVDAYVKAHASEFEVEATRDIKFVRFNIAATAEDENAMKAEVAKLINDREEYSNVTKGNIEVKGLKNATNMAEFFNENESDLAIDDNFKFKTGIPAVVAEEVIQGNKGDVFGPYKDRGFFKLSKVTEVIELPDSARASHILVPFVGAARVAQDVTRTEEEAKKLADSIYNVVKKSKTKFAALAKEFSSDRSNADKGGDLDWFNYNRMTPEFRDFVFEGKKGAMGVVKTPFGFHVIRIDDQKNRQKAVKLATFGRKIEASEATENTVFQNAETFALALANGNEFDATVKDKALSSSPAVGIKALDENVPGLGNQRSIITWAFGKETKVGDYKRFDIDKGYVVAVLTNKTEKGLMPATKAANRVRPILANEKKAKMIEAKMTGSTLADIAKSSGQSVRTASAVNLKSPTISGIGNEPRLVGAMVNAEENKVYNHIEGAKGVFAFKVTKKELPTVLPNYDTYRKQIAAQRKNLTYKMYEAVKEASKIEDNRPAFYGIQ